MSPEFAVGYSDGEIKAMQFVKKDVNVKFIGFVRSSQVQNFEGLDQKAIRAIHIFNVNAKTVNGHRCTDQTSYVYNNFPNQVKQYLDNHFNI